MPPVTFVEMIVLNIVPEDDDRHRGLAEPDRDGQRVEVRRRSFGPPAGGPGGVSRKTPARPGGQKASRAIAILLAATSLAVHFADHAEESALERRLLDRHPFENETP